MEDWCGNKQWQISEKWWKVFKHTLMECMMRKGGLVQNTQNVSNQNKVHWIILKPWTVKCTDIYKQQQAKLYTVTILCYRQAVQNLHKVPSVGVHTHFSRTYCGLYYIFYSMYLKKFLDPIPFSWQTYVISNKLIFHCTTKFLWSWQHYILCAVYFSITEHIKTSVHRFMTASVV